MTLAKQIKTARLNKGWTQLELCFHAEVSNNMICRIETGKQIPSVRTLLKIGKALCITIKIE